MLISSSHSPPDPDQWQIITVYNTHSQVFHYVYFGVYYQVVLVIGTDLKFSLSHPLTHRHIMRCHMRSHGNVKECDKAAWFTLSFAIYFHTTVHAFFLILFQVSNGSRYCTITCCALIVCRSDRNCLWIQSASLALSNLLWVHCELKLGKHSIYIYASLCSTKEHVLFIVQL